MKVGRKERTAAGTAPRESHPRVVLTRPCSLPATLQTLGLRRQGSIIVLSARRRPQAATPALRPGKIAPLIPMGKASWRTCRPARHRQNVSVCPMTRRHCPAGVFVKEQRGRRETGKRGKGKPPVYGRGLNRQSPTGLTMEWISLICNRRFIYSSMQI